MYLSSFRKHGVGPGNWGHAVHWWSNGPSADIVLDEVDDTLNSWKEAHDVFNTWQQEQPKVDGNAFSLMKPLVHKVIRDRLCNTVNSYPVEALTYALLERWISARKAEAKAVQCLRDPEPLGCTDFNTAAGPDTPPTE